MNGLVILEEAKLEWQNSVIWYEEQSSGLGLRFAEVIEKKIELITESPELFPKRKSNLREAVVNIFPFSIIFEFHQKRSLVTIVSVFQNKRNPKEKFKRVRK